MIFDASKLHNLTYSELLSTATYFFEEQQKAYLKIRKVINNDLEDDENFEIDIFYQPSDILNGDSYSIYKATNGDILVYVIDAMGHGIVPSFTSYSISAIVNRKMRTVANFHELMSEVISNLQYILTDEQQLTCGFFWFSKDFKKVEYVVAGMYAPKILDSGKIISAKANNIPFMNFAFDFNITTLEFEKFENFLIFTDGMIEDSQDFEINFEKMLKDKKYLQTLFKKLQILHLEDDTTILSLRKF